MLSLLDEMLAEPRLERMLGFNREREAIIAEVERRTLDEELARNRARADLELLLNDVCYHEEQRFRQTRSIDETDERVRHGIQRLRRGLRRATDEELRESVRELVQLYVGDIIGHFNPAMFTVVTRMLPVGLSLFFSPVRLGRSLADIGQLRERVLIEGQTADLERLSRRGTLVFVPTHLSNMDSIIIGFVLERARLPPVTYGAGKNLWSNPILGMFMRRLGAYRVDRRIKHDLYKHVLKSYSTTLLERGYHSLFFPGGTRSRSGAIESHLKLGLAGTALTASVNLMARGQGRPIYVVPTTINYHLTLEAPTLIEDYLKEAGKSRYIIEDDESTRLGRVARWMRDMLRAEGSLTVQFSEPLDVLGHRVGPDGQSYDDRGRPVELRPFFTGAGSGEIRPDPARDAEYTRELGERIVDSFRADTHVLSTHLVAYVLHRALVKAAQARAPRVDVFKVLRGAEGPSELPVAEVLAAIDRVKARLGEMAARRKVRLGARVAVSDAASILEDALRYFDLFADPPSVRRVGETIEVVDRSLCFYYHNRLDSYGLEDVA